MPSNISFLPVPAPASAPAPSTPSSDLPSADSGASFDSVLNKTAPSSGKSGSPRTSVTGSARAATESAESAKGEKAEKTKDVSKSEDTSSDTAPSLLSAEELAAMLALIGAPVPVQQPPAPAVATDLNFTGEPGTQESTDLAVGCESEFSSPQFATDNDRGVSVASTDGTQGTATQAVFTLATESTDAGLSARDLLKQGAEVIDYQLQPSGAPAAESVAPMSADILSADQAAAAVNAPQAPVAPSTAAETAAQSAAVVQQASASTSQSVDTAGLRRFAPGKTTSTTGSEKIAATPGFREPQVISGVKSSIYQDKNNFLNVGDKELASEVAPVGTDAANWGDSMNSGSRSTPFVARLIDGALSLLGTSSAGAATMDRPTEAPATPAASAAQAAQIVSEIRDIADGLWAVERNSVEVRFNYSPTERLSVKVEYRDGVVQTTFRTDSPELRDTIAREWQVQVASASEARPYRVADPVFNTPPADARGFSLGGDASRQQRQAEQSANASHTFATTSGRGPSSSSVAPASVTVSSRPDTALHLHAFA